MPWAALPNLFRQDMGVTFDRDSDELPKGRPKVNHAQGTVTMASWEDLGNHPYTGIYNGGSDKILMRLSESNFDLPEAAGLTPSFGLKFLRDGMRSVNMVTLANESFEPTDNFNFFSEDFYTRVFLFEDDCPKNTI